MINTAKYHTWLEVPLPTVVQELNRLHAGVIYYPQNFDSDIASVAFSDIPERDVLLSAIEGLELAMLIANRLGLDYSVYSSDELTLRSIQASAWQRLKKMSRSYGVSAHLSAPQFQQAMDI